MVRDEHDGAVLERAADARVDRDDEARRTGRDVDVDDADGGNSGGHGETSGEASGQARGRTSKFIVIYRTDCTPQELDRFIHQPDFTAGLAKAQYTKCYQITENGKYGCRTLLIT